MFTAALIVLPTLVLWWWAWRAWVNHLTEPWNNPKT